MAPGLFPIFSNPVLCSFFGLLDQLRRGQGKIWDSVNLSPRETPSREVFTEKGISLLTYPKRKNSNNLHPALLIIPAPIKQAYIWDLAPWASVVRQCIQRNLQVYIIKWERPEARTPPMGLADYSDRLILRCVDAIESETGQDRVFLTGHSLGGTFAAIFAALNAKWVKGLVLVGAPLHFGRNAGIFGSLVLSALPANQLTAWVGSLPGSFLSTVSFWSAPAIFGIDRWIDWQRSLSDGPRAIWTHLLVERWSLDEMPMNEQLFQDIIELLYREDRFMRGTLTINGKRAGPEFINMPILAVVDARCRLVPPQSVLPFLRATWSSDIQVLQYAGDTGVALQHLGMLVGQNAHKDLWPEIIRWIHSH